MKFLTILLKGRNNFLDNPLPKVVSLYSACLIVCLVAKEIPRLPLSSGIHSLFKGRP